MIDILATLPAPSPGRRGLSTVAPVTNSWREVTTRTLLPLAVALVSCMVECVRHGTLLDLSTGEPESRPAGRPDPRSTMSRSSTAR